MDRRIFDMLDLYRQNDNMNDTNPNKECYNPNFCLKTDYDSNTNGILTMAFVNMQPIDSVYETDEGFCRGTIFPNIDKPLAKGGKI